MYRAQLNWKPIAVLLLLAMTWGANLAFIKYAAREMAPLFMVGVRSTVASMVVFFWMRARAVPIFPSRGIIGHGAAVGVLFASEFALIYLGLQHTLASRTYILVYTAPFWVALGAHFFLQGDRLNAWKIVGLITAFSGVAVLFIRGFGPLSVRTLPGDLMALVAAMLWGGHHALHQAVSGPSRRSAADPVLSALFLHPGASRIEPAVRETGTIRVFAAHRRVAFLSVHRGGLGKLHIVVRTHPPPSGQPAARLYLFRSGFRGVFERGVDARRVDHRSPDHSLVPGQRRYDPGEFSTGRSMKTCGRRTLPPFLDRCRITDEIGGRSPGSFTRIDERSVNMVVTAGRTDEPTSRRIEQTENPNGYTDINRLYFIRFHPLGKPEGLMDGIDGPFQGRQMRRACNSSNCACTLHPSKPCP